MVEQMRYSMLINELCRCWYMDFVTFGQSQASCFPLFPVFVLRVVLISQNVFKRDNVIVPLPSHTKLTSV